MGAKSVFPVTIGEVFLLLMGCTTFQALGQGTLVVELEIITFGLPSGSYGRNNSTGTIGEPFSAVGNTYELNNRDAYGCNSIYGARGWKFASSEVDMPSFGHDIENFDPTI
jgi:RNA-binding protein Musashi